ncbi:MAG: hypothetical protein KC505_05230 [Myxococcales bacterium]|nr:hypothetical protein [Myxococcales bacterium]USN51193.1 MAG: hypothetical protein H6731_01935 [Myxococcales bacterium]
MKSYFVHVLILVANYSLFAGIDFQEQPSFVIPVDNAPVDCGAHSQNHIEEDHQTWACCGWCNKDPKQQEIYQAMLSSSAVPTKCGCLCCSAKSESPIECSFFGGCFSFKKAGDLLEQCKVLWCCYCCESADTQ